MTNTRKLAAIDEIDLWSFCASELAERSVNVRFADLPDRLKGYAVREGDKGVIVLQQGRSELDTFRTLLHEAAHILLQFGGLAREHQIEKAKEVMVIPDQIWENAADRQADYWESLVTDAKSVDHKLLGLIVKVGKFIY